MYDQPAIVSIEIAGDQKKFHQKTRLFSGFMLARLIRFWLVKMAEDFDRVRN